MSENFDRKAIRQQFADLLSAILVGDDNLVRKLYSWQVDDFGGVTTVIVVSSGGSLPAPFTARGGKNKVYLLVHVFVRYADPEIGWTEEHCENALDDIATKLIDSVNNPDFWRSTNWADVRIGERSRADGIDIGGVDYRREAFPVEIGVFA